MEFRICDFNIGDVTIEYDLEHGELTAFHIYRVAQTSNEHIEITKFVDQAALEEVIEEIVERSKENGAYEDSFEPDFTEEDSA